MWHKSDTSAGNLDMAQAGKGARNLEQLDEDLDSFFGPPIVGIDHDQLVELREYAETLGIKPTRGPPDWDKFPSGTC